MYWRREFLRKSKAMSLGSTYKVDLPDHGLLGSIMFMMTGTGISGYLQTEIKDRILDYITKIEIVANGSIVIKSISGQELNALMTYDQGVAGIDYWHDYTGTKWCHLLMNFGRKFFDREYGLDLSKWNNVEIKITNDGNSDAFSGNFALTVELFLKEEDVSGFVGYFKTEEWRSYTTTQSETKYLELPVENKIRRIMVQLLPAYKNGDIVKTNMFNLAHNLKFSLFTGKLVVFDGYSMELAYENYLDMGKDYITSRMSNKSDGQGFNIGLGRALGGAWGAGQMGAAAGTTVPNMIGRNTDQTQEVATRETEILIQSLWKGFCPENTLLIPFNRIDDPGEYLDPEAKKTVQIDIFTRGIDDCDDGTVNVVLDRLV
ncbi:hypothetical protein ES708_20216 [subsurface metagenome]